MTTILITGSMGRLGKHLAKEFPGVLTPRHSELDVTEREKVFSYVETHKPDIVIHCAAWVDIRGCESDNARAWRINIGGTENMVDAVERFVSNCYFVFPSTGGVFFGDRGGYSEEDAPKPQNYYGLTKLVAEYVVKRLPNYFIFRTDFVDRARWRYEGAFIDRYSTCVFSDTLARELKKLIGRRLTGLIHLTGRRKITHYELAKITTPDVKPIRLSDVDVPLQSDQSLKSVKGFDYLELEY